MTDIARADGYNYGMMKDSLFNSFREAYPSLSVNASQIAQWIAQANNYLDSRLMYSMAKFKTVTVENQPNYDLWDAPIHIQAVVCNGKLLTQISFKDYLQRVSDAGDSTSSETQTNWTRFADDLYLWPWPSDSGNLIEVYMYQAPPLMQNNSDVPAVPPVYHRLIIQYAKYLGFCELPGMEQAASFHLKQFETEFAVMATMAEGDRVTTRVEPPTERIGGG